MWVVFEVFVIIEGKWGEWVDWSYFIGDCKEVEAIQRRVGWG